MSETLLGVIVGGLIASLTPIITIIYGHFKWKKELRIEYLKAKRNRFEKAFKSTHEAIVKGTIINSYPIDILADILVLFPNSVSEELNKFNELMLKNESEDAIKSAIMNFNVAMKKELAIMDSIIEAEIKYEFFLNNWISKIKLYFKSRNL